MQDRFKYRVWNNKKRKYEDAENDTLDYFICCIPGVVYESHCCVFDDLTEAEEGHYTLEQCTALKDKNGRLIYEGDILGGVLESTYVHWCKDCKGFQLNCMGECMSCGGDIHWYEVVEDDGKLEVIGNIHENPDLLED